MSRSRRSWHRLGVLLVTTATTAFPSALSASSPMDDLSRIAAEHGVDALPEHVMMSDDAGRLRITIRHDGTPGARPALEAAGLEVTSCAGDVCAAWASAAELPAVAALGAAVRLEIAEVAIPTLDMSVPATGATTVRELFGLDGAGAAVGIIDTGCDWRHEDFRNADGTTRMLYLLDLTTSPEASGFPDLGPSPIEAPRGTLYTADDINRALFEDPSLVREEDTFGHGSHVAGIAAGGGGPDGLFIGVAPAATILCVKADRNARFNTADLIDAVTFVFDAASAHGLPIAVNMSLGSQGGAHDGSNNSERAFTALVEAPVPGRSVVVSAGNDGARDIHASGFATPDSPMVIEFETVDYAYNRDAPGKGISISAYLPADADVAVYVDTPAGERLGPLLIGLPSERFETGAGRVTVAVCADGPRAEGDCSVTVLLRDNYENALRAGVWRVRFEGDSRGRIDAWFGSSISGPAGSSRLMGALDPDNRVASPSTAPGALSIGSYVTRNSWIRFDGEEVAVGSTIGGISSFSSTGPGRGLALEVFKPDFAAPGEYIISTFSTDAPPTSDDSAFGSSLPPGNLVHADGTHAALRGTSMSAPHVTGLVALLFQENPWLTQDDVRAVLRAGATADAATGLELPDSRWGFGKVNVWNSVRLLRGEGATTLSPEATRVGTNVDLAAPGTLQPVTVFVVPAGSDGLPMGGGQDVVVEATAGTWIGAVEHRGYGVYTRRLLPPDRVLGAAGVAEAIITVTVNGVTLPTSPRLFFADEREDIGRTPGVRGGTGCRVSPPGTRGDRPAGPMALSAIILVLVATRRRRRP